MPNQEEDRIQFEWLALRSQTGDPEAFADLIAVMERPLLYYATSLTGNQDTVLDALQDVWFKVVRSIRTLKDLGALRPWLYVITHGIAVDCIRRDYKRDKAEQSQLDDVINNEEPSFGAEDASAIRNALSRLGVEHREVLVLHFLEDLSILEIANVVDCSEGTVKSRIHYPPHAALGLPPQTAGHHLRQRLQRPQLHMIAVNEPVRFTSSTSRRIC